MAKLSRETPGPGAGQCNARATHEMAEVFGYWMTMVMEKLVVQSRENLLQVDPMDLHQLSGATARETTNH